MSQVKYNQEVLVIVIIDKSAIFTAQSEEDIALFQSLGKIISLCEKKSINECVIIRYNKDNYKEE